MHVSLVYRVRLNSCVQSCQCTKSVRTLSNFMKISRNSSAATFQTGHDDSAPVRGRCLSRDVNTPSAPSRDLIDQFFWSKTSQLFLQLHKFSYIKIMSVFALAFSHERPGIERSKRWRWRPWTPKLLALLPQSHGLATTWFFPPKSLQWHYIWWIIALFHMPSSGHKEGN